MTGQWVTGMYYLVGIKNSAMEAWVSKRRRALNQRLDRERQGINHTTAPCQPFPAFHVVGAEISPGAHSPQMKQLREKLNDNRAVTRKGRFIFSQISAPWWPFWYETLLMIYTMKILHLQIWAVSCYFSSQNAYSNPTHVSRMPKQWWSFYYIQDVPPM